MFKYGNDFKASFFTTFIHKYYSENKKNENVLVILIGVRHSQHMFMVWLLCFVQNVFVNAPCFRFGFVFL